MVCPKIFKIFMYSNIFTILEKKNTYNCETSDLITLLKLKSSKVSSLTHNKFSLGKVYWNKNRFVN